MLKAGLDVSATSDKHLEILYKYVRCMYGKRDVNFTKEYTLQQFIDTYKAFEEA